MRHLALLSLLACATTPAMSQRQQAATSCSVLAYGATADDGTDDRAAIQAALDACDEVTVPPGLFLVAGTLHVFANRALVGESRETSVLQQFPGLGPNVRLIQPGPGQSNPPASPSVTIRDLTLDGNKLQQSADEHRAGVFASNAQGLRIEHVTARNFTGDGFYVYNHSDGVVIDDVLAEDNDRDGIVFGGGTTGGLVANSTFRGNRAQQFDTEGGKVDGLTVTGNTIDGSASNDYAFTVAGANSTARSSGWLISSNVITGGMSLTWVDDALITLNRGTNHTTKPSVSLWRTTNNVSLTANNFANTNTTQLNNAVVYIAGTGTGSATTDFVARGNVLTHSGHPSGFGYRIEGAVSVEIWDDVLIGPGVASPGAAGVYLRATNQVEDFQSARIAHTTFRNWGALGVTVAGNGTARLNRLELAYNSFEDSAGTMTRAISPDTDRAHAAKDVCIVANTLSGGCTTLLTSTPTGTWQAWGDRWTVP